MKATEIIREIMRNNRVSQSVMAKRIGKNSYQAVGIRLNKENITFKSASEMLKVLGYKIVIMPDTQRTPTDAYEVD